MDFLSMAKARYSVREYTQQKVEEEKVQQILEAGRIAPTAANVQPQRFLVIQSEEGLAKVKKGANCYGAPLVIIVCGDHNNVWVRPFDKKDMVEVDTTIATDHMMHQASALGLGTCWITYFEPTVIREQFNIPAHLEPVNILAIGYAQGKQASPERFDAARKPLTELVISETF